MLGITAAEALILESEKLYVPPSFDFNIAFLRKNDESTINVISEKDFSLFLSFIVYPPGPCAVTIAKYPEVRAAIPPEPPPARS